MRASLVLVLLVACGSKSAAPTAGSGAPPQEPAEPPPAVAADAPAKIAAAQKAWLAGDLPAAIANLTAAGGDPLALGLLARAQELTGKPADAKATLAHLPPAKAHLATDASGVSCGTFTTDGAYLATCEYGASLNRVVRVWNVLTGRDVFAVAGMSPMFTIDPKTKAPILIVELEGVKGAQSYDAATGKALAAFDDKGARLFTFAADETGVVTAWGNPKTIYQFDLATGKKLRAVATQINAGYLHVSADGATIMYGGQVFELPANATAPTILGEAPPLTSATPIVAEELSRDGKSIATAGRTGEVAILERDGKPRAHLDHAGSQIAWMTDDTLLALDGRHVSRIDRTGKVVAEAVLPAESKPLEREWYAMGRGGHVVGREGDALVVYAIAGTKAVPIAHLGGATRATAIAWSADGKQLGFAGANKQQSVWSAADDAVVKDTLPSTGYSALDAVGFGADGKLTDGRPEGAPTDATGNRVFVYSDAAHPKTPTRMFEVGKLVVATSRGGDRVAAVDEDGVVHLYNATTGEGLGTLGQPMLGTAIAMRPDGKTLAIAQARGVELWDLGARAAVAALAGGGAYAAVDPTGAFAGDATEVSWSAGPVEVGAAAVGAKPIGKLVAAALAKPPAAVTFAATPAVVAAARGCLPAESADAMPQGLALTGDKLAFCIAAYGEDPYCFAADLAAKTIVPAPTPPAALVPLDENFPGSSRSQAHATIEPKPSGGVTVCTADKKTCHDVAVDSTEGKIAASDDGAVIAVDRTKGDTARTGTVETIDVATGKSIAKFKVRFGTKDQPEDDGVREVGFLDHSVLTINIPCAGPCGAATMYDVHGKKLGELAAEASTVVASRFHDSLFVMSSIEGTFVVQDAATGKVYETDGGAKSDYVVSPERIVLVSGGGRPPSSDDEGSGSGSGSDAKPPAVPKVTVYDAAVKKQFEIPIPLCPPAPAK